MLKLNPRLENGIETVNHFIKAHSLSNKDLESIRQIFVIAGLETQTKEIQKDKIRRKSSKNVPKPYSKK